MTEKCQCVHERLDCCHSGRSIAKSRNSDGTTINWVQGLAIGLARDDTIGSTRDFVACSRKSNPSAARECPGFGSGFVGGALQLGAELIAPFMDRGDDKAGGNSEADERGFG